MIIDALAVLFQSHINRGKDAANIGQQVRNKCQRNSFTGKKAQLLNHLWLMAVSRDAVGFEIIGELGAVQTDIGFAAGTADAGFTVRNNRNIQIYDIADFFMEFKQRHESELNGGRIAACHAKNVRLLHFVPHAFRLTVDGFSQNLRTFVVHLVPLLKNFFIFQTEICGKVNNFDALGSELFGHAHRYAVRRRKKHDIALIQRG